MNFYQIRQTMTDDAYDVISAFGQTASLAIQTHSATARGRQWAI
ncbi:hypothetical protein [Erwinia tracheiphila]|nr:hypothetical protein [Erwinia tracheiphila]